MVEPPQALQAELRPYQKLGVQWLSTLRSLELGGCLADDMGLGKTIQVLGMLSLSQRNIGLASLIEGRIGGKLSHGGELGVNNFNPIKTSLDNFF